MQSDSNTNLDRIMAAVTLTHTNAYDDSMEEEHFYDLLSEQQHKQQQQQQQQHLESYSPPQTSVSFSRVPPRSLHNKTSASLSTLPSTILHALARQTTLTTLPTLNDLPSLPSHNGNLNRASHVNLNQRPLQWRAHITDHDENGLLHLIIYHIVRYKHNNALLIYCFIAVSFIGAPIIYMIGRFDESQTMSFALDNWKRYNIGMYQSFYRFKFQRVMDYLDEHQYRTLYESNNGIIVIIDDGLFETMCFSVVFVFLYFLLIYHYELML